MNTFKAIVTIGDKSMEVTIEDLRAGININLGNVISIIDTTGKKEKVTTLTMNEISDIKPTNYAGQYSEIYPDVLRVYIPGAEQIRVDFSSLIGGLRNFYKFVLHSPTDDEFTFMIPIPKGINMSTITEKVIKYFKSFGIVLYDVSARNTIIRAEDSGNGYTETIKDDVNGLRIMQDYIKNNPNYFN